MRPPAASCSTTSNFETPQTHLESTSDCGRDANLVFSDYPANTLSKVPDRTLLSYGPRSLNRGGFSAWAKAIPRGWPQDTLLTLSNTPSTR